MFGEGGYESVCSRRRVCEKMCSGSVAVVILIRKRNRMHEDS